MFFFMISCVFYDQLWEHCHEKCTEMCSRASHIKLNFHIATPWADFFWPTLWIESLKGTASIYSSAVMCSTSLPVVTKGHRVENVIQSHVSDFKGTKVDIRSYLVFVYRLYTANDMDGCCKYMIYIIHLTHRGWVTHKCINKLGHHWLR